MTSNAASTKRHRNAPLARLLAFVLLAFITYSATVETGHRHGGLSLNTSGSSSTPTVKSSGDADSSAKDSRTIGDCLICQLRQQLSFSLFSTLPQIVAPQIQIARTPAAALPSFSRPDAPQRGRAPPLNSLI